ncbi:S9 family peptidase [Shewanella cyperi]|uniref:S9 family peptidase n=1 Tax=Shewanella cyperi TaxID=2814292 RepID=A0A974XR65_9GAMM|nr:prolyl oligopeptidase family serine peptidase [Shewanella cyperi]QSX31796.1 S9 family peptidase [Shewanella cyperi]
MKYRNGLLCLLAASAWSLWLWGCEPSSSRGLISEQEPVRAAAYGSWASPLSAADVYRQTDQLLTLQSVGNRLYFSQSYGEQGGGVGVGRLEPDGAVVQVVGAGFDAVSRIHEYGGAPFLAIGQTLFATRRSDQLFYRFAPNQPPLALTPNGTRHGDCIAYPKGSRIICVREDHRQQGEARASLVTINLNFPGEGDTLVDGHDFISSPTINADNSQLAWLTWEHPNMPWDNTQLWLADLDRKGQLQNARVVAGNIRKGAVTQPLFSPAGTLYFIADFDNWWNLYRLNPNGQVQQVLRRPADFAVPAWRMGSHNFAFESENQLIAAYLHNGEASLVRITLDSGSVEKLAVDFGEISQVVKGHDGVYFIGAKETPEKGIYRVAGRGVELVYTPQLASLDPRYVSRAQNINFRTSGDQWAWGYFYWPRNPHFQGLPDTRPPLLVTLHGGPTAKASLAFRSDIQFWTSRGFAVLDLNYRGSSGFGRAYRQSLYGNWGKADVEDAVYAAKHLVDKGWVDDERLAISGVSAGGATVLGALAYDDTFKAGAARGAISDLESLAQETHKFESHYLDKLIGPWPQAREVYHNRSPLYRLDKLAEPLLLAQGQHDNVVAPTQARAIRDSLLARHVPVALLEFPDEAHGQWKPDNLARVLENELGFYGKVFGFTPADQVPVPDLMPMPGSVVSPAADAGSH